MKEIVTESEEEIVKEKQSFERDHMDHQQFRSRSCLQLLCSKKVTKVLKKSRVQFIFGKVSGLGLQVYHKIIQCFPVNFENLF